MFSRFGLLRASIARPTVARALIARPAANIVRSAAASSVSSLTKMVGTRAMTTSAAPVSGAGGKKKASKWKSIVAGIVASLAAGGVYAATNAWTPSPPRTAGDIAASATATEKPLGYAFRGAGKRGAVEYFVHGDPNGKETIVALHGAQTTGNLFALLDKWGKEKGVKIVAPTLRGYGQSSYIVDQTYNYTAGYPLADWVEDMNELLGTHLGLKSFHVLGTSFGSIHAVALTTLYKDQNAIKNVELHVAFAPFEKDDKSGKAVHDPLAGSMLADFAKMRESPTQKRVLEKVMVLPMLKAMGGDVERSLRWQWEGAYSCADVIYGAWPHNWRSIGANGARRVIVVSGTGDTVAPPHNQKRLISEIKGSELIEYSGAHERAVKEPELLIQHVTQLLSERKSK